MSTVAEEAPSAATSVDVAIIMDCTGSMGSWIASAKATALKTAEQITKDIPGAKYRLGFVGYRDHCDKDRFIEIPLTSDIGKVSRELQPVSASGGGDAPEDVAGGLDKALKLKWEAETRIILFVADAPAHGSEYHEASLRDSYPGGDPAGFKPVEQIAEVARRGIDFYFIKCTTYTDIMLKLFAAAYEGARVNEAQVFCVLDLQPQSSSSSPSRRSHSSIKDECSGVSDCLSSLDVSEKTRPVLASTARFLGAASASSSAPRASATLRRTRDVAPAESTEDAFFSALTSSVKRSVNSRAKAKDATS